MNRDEALLEELAELIRRIETSVAGKSLADVLADADCYDANTFRLAAIGETSARLSSDLKGRHGELNWRAMVAFRNVVSHDYFESRRNTSGLRSMISIGSRACAGKSWTAFEATVEHEGPFPTCWRFTSSERHSFNEIHLALETSLRRILEQ
ncbi:MAG: DUF86 domain-containing protein [Sphingobium sp.]